MDPWVQQTFLEHLPAGWGKARSRGKSHVCTVTGATGQAETPTQKPWPPWDRSGHDQHRKSRGCCQGSEPRKGLKGECGRRAPPQAEVGCASGSAGLTGSQVTPGPAGAARGSGHARLWPVGAVVRGGRGSHRTAGRTLGAGQGRAAAAQEGASLPGLPTPLSTKMPQCAVVPGTC